LGIIGGWQLAASMGVVSTSNWSSPALVFDRLWSIFASGMIWPHLFDSISSTITALGIAGVLGTALGITLDRHKLLEATLDPLLAALQGIPRIAFAPLIILFLGIGFAAKVTLSVSIVLFVFYANVQSGLGQISPTLLRNLELMGAGPREQFRMAVFPSLVPWLWASLDLSLGLSLIGVIISEFISSTRGLGHLISAASLGFDTTGLIALLVVTMVVVVALHGTLAALKARLMPWTQQ
jgi:NitT/TauT family transport system permease protein